MTFEFSSEIIKYKILDELEMAHNHKAQICSLTY